MRNNVPAYKLHDLKEKYLKQGLVMFNPNIDETLVFHLGIPTKQAMLKIIIEDLKPSHFYKTEADFRFPGKWQDFYHLPFGETVLFIKLTMREYQGKKVLVSSFKIK